MNTIKDTNRLTFENLMNINNDQAREILESFRWPDGVICPKCGSRDVVAITGKSEKVRKGLYRCRECRKNNPKQDQFTVTVGTIFESSHISIRKWLMAIAITCASKKGVSALQLKRMLGLGSYHTAWFMLHRVRYAMKLNPKATMLKGDVEVDETYIGGKSREGKRGRGSERKTPVVVLVERKGRARTKVVTHVGSKELKGVIREVVARDATIMTDEWRSYQGIGNEYAGHQVVQHGAREYARGNAHVNNAESFFALLKRGIHGIFHSVSVKYLPRYCEEFGFRWNHRLQSDAERAQAVIRKAEGRRIMFKDLTEKKSV